MTFSLYILSLIHISFVLCLVMAYAAEELFGVADIIGAFAAGLMIANTPKAKYIESKFSPLSYLLLTPVFFASIGIKVELPAMTPSIVLFALLLAVVAILSKIVGCGLGACVCGFRMRQCLQIGCGMACRGEVALIVANKGMAMGLVSPTPVSYTHLDVYKRQECACVFFHALCAFGGGDRVDIGDKVQILDSRHEIVQVRIVRKKRRDGFRRDGFCPDVVAADPDLSFGKVKDCLLYTSCGRGVF